MMRCHAGGASFLAVGAVALSILIAPVASAQVSIFESVSGAVAATIQVADVDGVETEPANPFCFITGPTSGPCGGAPAVFIATAPSTTQLFNATWSLHSNTAGASFVGPSSCFGVLSCQATVATSNQGSVIIRVTLNFPGGVQKTCQVTYTVQDTSPPTITCPPNVTVPCGSPIDPSVTGTATATDCGPTTVSFLDTSGGSNCAGAIITRTWTATDSIGLFATCVQTITRTSAVSITCPGPVSVQAFSQMPAPNVGSVTASDACGLGVTVTHVGDVATNGTSSCNNIITRTYMVVNGCGNSATCTQTITVNDTTIPSVTCPGPVSVQCFSQVPAPNVGSVTASDNSGASVTVTHFGDSASNGTSSCNNVITRTYRAMDTCGNQAFCTQTITVNDTTIPSITCPGPVSVQCFSLVPLPNPGVVVASDNCGGFVGVVHVGDVATNGTSSCNNVMTRTYRATDACGNQNTCTQTITVNDTMPPTVLCPGPISFQCFSQVPAPATIAVNAFDNCGGPVTVAHVSDVATNGTSSCNNVITRTYSGTDACGNQATCTQTITVNDTTPPNIQCPASVSVQCFSLVPPPAIGSVIASDNCGGQVTVAHVSSLASNGTSSCNNVITRTYQGTDLCGNVQTCTQMITVNDTTPPTVTCPGPVSVQCFALVPPPAIASVTAVDNCGGAVTVTHVSDVATNGQLSCNNTITRTYRGTDACGNQQTCTQTITVNDTTPPTVTCPGPVSVQCFALIPPAAIGSVTAVDNCGGAVTVAHVSDVATNGTSSCNNTITRTYRGTDACGNQQTCTQTITVNDTTPPTVTCPAPVSVQCFSLVPPPAIGSVTAVDNCGGAVTVTHVSDVATNGQLSCNNTITRTYRGTDACGNQQTCTQTITVNDTTPPTVTCPGPVSVQCFALVPPPAIASVTAVDNCGGAVTVIHVGDVATNGQSSCNNVITRTYRGTDLCGNQQTCTQTITVNDTTLPTITCPGPLSFQCFSQLPAPSTTAVIASDNCGGAVTLAHVSDVTSNGTSSCNNIITRTYSATDLCGNQNTCTQLITVNDTTAPVITCPPDPFAICGTSIDPTVTGQATALDDCDPAPVIGFTDVTGGGCPTMQEIITRTWTATDACQNMSSCVQFITLTVGGGAITGCTIDLGGGCGVPQTPTLSDLLSGPPPTLTLVIAGAAPNESGVIAAQTPPFQTMIPLGPPCRLGIDPLVPETVYFASFNTDASGAWSMPITPIPTMFHVRLQAAIVTPQPQNDYQLTNALEIVRPGPCPPCTYNRPEWAAVSGPEAVNYDGNWVGVFPGGMDIGLFNGGAPGFGIHWTGDTLGRNALKSFLSTFGGLPSPTLTSDGVNVINSTTGSFGRLLAVLQLNIAFNAAGFLGGSTPGFGAFIYTNPGDALDGFTVSQILVVANQVISGAFPPPAGYGFGTMVALLEDLHTAFDDCVASPWSMVFLVAP